MGYLYKLVDEIEIKNAKEGIISFSHPIFEFKGSEGKIINFAKRIYNKYKKKGLNITPTQKDLTEIKEWIEVYKSSYGEKREDVHINSETMNMFCGIMQGFCAYFTKINLFDKEKLDNFIMKSVLKGKTAVLRLDDSIFEQYHHWRTFDLNEPFSPFIGNPYDLKGYNGATHPRDIVYTTHYDDYKELLNIYNATEIRKASNRFNNLSADYEWQQEKRIIFLIRSYEKNSARVGCDRVYNYPQNITSWEEIVYCNIVDAIDYCQKGPRFISLDVGKEAVTLRNFGEI